MNNIFLYYNYCPSICEHVLDFPKENYTKWGIFPKHNYKNFNTKNIKEGDKIYVKPDLLNLFFTKHFKKISNSFILISSGGGMDIGSEYKKFLENNKIIKWFGTNILFEHDKIFKIPIGFEENERCRDGTADGEGGDQILLKEAYDNKILFKEKENKILITYLGSTHNSRNNLIEKIDKDLYVKIDKKSFENYMKEINKYKFVLCPRGSGTDTHRFWETILVGSVPILENSGLDNLYNNFPCIIVNNFSEIKKELLDNFKYDLEKSKNVDKYLLIKEFNKLIF